MSDDDLIAATFELQESDRRNPFALAAKDRPSVEAQISSAVGFLEAFKWCRRVAELRLGCVIPGVMALLLARIVSNRSEVPPWLWVVVGDLPPAYLVPDEARSPQAALEAYVEEMQLWVEAVRRGTPLDEVIPVNAEPTPENATQLASRLRFLREQVLPALSGEEPSSQ